MSPHAGPPVAPFALALLAALSLAACGPGHSTRPAARADAATIGSAPGTTNADPLAAASTWVAEKNWPQALAALRSIIDDKTFSTLPSDVQYRALSIAGKVASYHGPAELGYEYLGRTVAMPQADYGDWSERLQAAGRLGHKADWMSALTVLMQRWPERAGNIDPDYILQFVIDPHDLPSSAVMPLLQALYDAHWKLQWNIEPSATWRDLALLLLEKDRVREANEVATHITDSYVLIAMRADRRFDAMVAANPAQFDIERAAQREFHALQAASDAAPQSLQLKSWVIESLLHQQHYEAALAAADSILSDIRTTNYPGKLYEDFAETHSWFLELRSTALQRVGRWDESVAQLAAASLLSEKYGGNIDQVINLGDLYCSLDRPHDALSTIASVSAGMGPFGAMQLENVRLNAASQLGDVKQVERSLRYLRVHRSDAPGAYEDALIIVNQADRAARELIAELTNPVERQSALLGVQDFALTPSTPRDRAKDARRRSVIARADVQAEISKVGRIESYLLEEE